MVLSDQIRIQGALNLGRPHACAGHLKNIKSSLPCRDSNPKSFGPMA
jgi:hypothetical protein